MNSWPLFSDVKVVRIVFDDPCICSEPDLLIPVRLDRIEYGITITQAALFIQVDGIAVFRIQDLHS